ncbi:hypothetical protein ACH5RR_017865 [Cinchona calisaya]|uniref:F-box domain-containing protein n=1 Tax=Cinchona calisaya TaxID=153742 RepID=A0ABD2ZLJ3_9GENT
MLKICRMINYTVAALVNNRTKRLKLDHPETVKLDIPEELYLPNEILQDIFSRLPAKYVLRCASVCRRWKCLTMFDNDFALLHYEKQSSISSTTIVVEMHNYHDERRLNEGMADTILNTKKRLYSFDTLPRGETIKVDGKKAVKLCLDSEYRHVDAGEEDESTALFMSISSCGLLVFHHQNLYDMPFSSYCIILNPVTQHKLKITLPSHDKNSHRGLVYGLFFHPVMKELCLLMGQVPHKQQPPGYLLMRRLRYTLEFKLLNLGPSPSRWRSIPTRLEEYYQQPRLTSYGVIPPVIVDDVLYWITGNYEDIVNEIDYPTVPTACQEAVLAFDIKSQELYFLPHPHPFCPFSEHAVILHPYMNLIAIGGGADLGFLSLEQGGFGIWSLVKSETSNNIIVNKSSFDHHHQGGLWIKKYVLKTYPGLDTRFFEPIALLGEDDGQLLLLMNWRGVGLFVHDLKLGTTKLFETKRKDGVTVGASMCAHTHTFFSPHNNGY